MSEMKKMKLVSKVGDTLNGLSWTIDNPKANVIIMEGMEEHASRYDGFAQYLNKEGFDVYAIDVYGQGENVKEDLSNRGIWPQSAFRHNTCLYTSDRLILLPRHIRASSYGLQS